MPDKQKIIFGESVLSAEHDLPLEYQTWLSMYKGYETGLCPKDEWYGVLEELLESIFGAGALGQLKQKTLQSMDIWRLSDGRN